MTEDEAYELVAAELAKGERKPGLMAKAIAESGGDERRAQSLYIKHRGKQIIDSCRTAELESKQRAAAQRKSDKRPFLTAADIEYVTVRGAIALILGLIFVAIVIALSGGQ